MSDFFIIIFIFIFTAIPSYAALEGGLEYQIPIDYTKLDESELQEKAGFYYNLVLKSSLMNEDMTAALNLYTMLAEKNPENITYLTRLGTLYDIAGKDRYAKGAFYRALGVNPSAPEPYFRLGEFYYKRTLYKKALKMYKEAYKSGYTRHYDTLYKLGDIYEKLGDTKASVKYLRQASELSPNAALDDKIKRVEISDKLNGKYYSDTRIRTGE